MTSVVYFKLRSAVEQYQVRFDGLSIPVSELKDAIMQRLAIDKDYRSDVKLFNPNTNEGAPRAFCPQLHTACVGPALIARAVMQNTRTRPEASSATLLSSCVGCLCVGHALFSQKNSPTGATPFRHHTQRQHASHAPTLGAGCLWAEPRCLRWRPPRP